MLKPVIVILLLAIIFNLVVSAVFYFKDQGNRKRTMYLLGVRVSLAALLLIVVVYGVVSGELTLGAPWHNR